MRFLSLSAPLAAALAVAGSLALSMPSAATTKPVVNVAYAGSLADLMDNTIGPRVAQMDGLVYQGRGAGSFALAQEIKLHLLPADVFYSIGTAPFAVLGKRMPWTVTFATAPLVLAYNPASKFAPTLRAIAQGKKPFRDLFSVLESPGFRLGRTNPETDPQGRAFYLMVVLAQKLYGLPAGTVAKILGTPENSRQIFSETGILTELQSGALDASSAFLPEAIERHLDYVPLPPAIDFGDANDTAIYAQAHAIIPTVGKVTGSLLTVAAGPVIGSGQYAAGVRFLETSVGPALAKAWTENGYDRIPFRYTGPLAKIPAALKRESP
jgi:molybdate/tungstate transport system substrate-binding protein